MKLKYIHPEVCLIKAKNVILAGSGYTEPGKIPSHAGSFTNKKGTGIVMSKQYNAWDDDNLGETGSRDSLW